MQHRAIAPTMCSPWSLGARKHALAKETGKAVLCGEPPSESSSSGPFRKLQAGASTLVSVSPLLVYCLVSNLICLGLASRGTYAFNVYPGAAIRATILITPTGITVGKQRYASRIRFDDEQRVSWHWGMTARVSEQYKNRLDYSFHSFGGGSTRVAWLGRLTNASESRPFLGHCPMITKNHAPPGYATDGYSPCQPFHWALDT
ncbi:hypothetical protein B0H65DRAFT_196255 [Neurospora tetraspora]|uniref:Uncharacterized protein n=1 Tax=Neurospora tetraspora TaxID=94610 RepID=A0AAE0JG87_9PEZI|nr:hypothetical protein B0H65DRAFT_196255 [Neurospora tetraspora]